MSTTRKHKKFFLNQNIFRSERPKRPKLVSAETEISAKLTETSAEFSAEILPKNYVKLGGFSQEKLFKA